MKIRVHVRGRGVPAKDSAGRFTAIWVLRSAELFFWITGVVLLISVAAIYFYSGVYQAIETQRFNAKLEVPAPVLHTSPTTASSSLKSSQFTITRGSPFAKVEVPRLGISVMLIEGIEPKSLRVAVGHIPGTAFPGEPGNAGIAGHRDTYFRALRKIRRDDLVQVTTLYGHYVYAVESTKVVAPTDVDVLATTAEPILTLVTCYPFSYVGPAPERFIVRARLETDFKRSTAGLLEK